MHLLAYLPDPSYQPLAAEMARVRGGRESRLPVMMERLRALGIDITEDDVRDGAAEGAVLGRPHVADALVGKGVVGHRNEAFETMLGPGGPAFVPRYATSLPDAVDAGARGGRRTRRRPPVGSQPGARPPPRSPTCSSAAWSGSRSTTRTTTPAARERAAPDRRATSGWSSPAPATGTAPARSTTSSAATPPTPAEFERLSLAAAGGRAATRRGARRERVVDGVTC